MHDILIAICLGVVQGLTEFLPVSSSGHLCILQGMFGEKWLGNILFDVSVHLGTTLAILVFFFKDITTLVRGILPKTYKPEQARIVMALVITTVVTGTLGLIFKDSIESLFFMPRIAASMLLITGVLTFFTDRMGKEDKKYGTIGIRDAIIIGLFQAFAIIPGISRSGSTIFAGIACGMERPWAAAFSFIAAIPAVMGAVVLEWSSASSTVSMIDIAGGISAFIVGLISLKFLVWILKKRSFIVFSVYCWLAGGLYLIYTI
ncbi:MAG: undecaprenyl-diphosphate phosphatase [Thermodesulfobacteriota bacterium]|nr:undecaprenyl-diphosphate phosphatase [Thermodesulfobacteriota bacterium]